MLVQCRFGMYIGHVLDKEDDMSEEQKDRILPAVEQAAAGLITGNELLAKLEAITGEKFGTEADLGLMSAA